MKTRKIVALLNAFVLLCSCSYSNINIKAQEVSNDDSSIQVQTEAPNLIDNYDEDSILCNKLEYDADNNVTHLKTDVEKELNEAGIFDDEYIEVKFRCRYENKYVVFATSYHHSMTSKSITPSISFSGSGISVGISGSSNNYYEKLSYNAYMDYKHI